MITADEIREIQALLGTDRQSVLAARIGVSQPTVSRWLRAEDPSTPNPQQEEALRELKATLLGEGTSSSSAVPPFRVKAANRAVSPSAKPAGLVSAQDDFTLTRVDRLVGAGIFRRVELFDDDLGELISAPRDPEFPWARQVAYRVEGDSMNDADPKPINDGDFIICAIWEDLDIADVNGLNVVVEQLIDDGRLLERSVKEVHRFEDRTEFHPRSKNKLHEPIIVHHDPDPNDGREVRILALVRFVFDNQPIGRARSAKSRNQELPSAVRSSPARRKDPE